MTFLYTVPQAQFPYSRPVEETRRRDWRAPEFELMDTGVFEGGRYFDVLVEYAKAAPDDILIRITATNRGPEPAGLHLLPTVWFRNTWSWDASATRPVLRAGRAVADHALIEAEHEALGPRWLYSEGAPELLFSENETNRVRHSGGAIPRARRPLQSACRGGTTSGSTSTTRTSSRCRTSGSTRGTRRGTSRSTRFRSRWSTPTSPRHSSSCSCASGTCIRTARSRRTS